MKEKKRNKGEARKFNEWKDGMDGNGQADVSVGSGRWAPGEAFERSKWTSFPSELRGRSLILCYHVNTIFL